MDGPKCLKELVINPKSEAKAQNSLACVNRVIDAVLGNEKSQWQDHQKNHRSLTRHVRIDHQVLEIIVAGFEKANIGGQ